MDLGLREGGVDGRISSGQVIRIGNEVAMDTAFFTICPSLRT